MDRLSFERENRKRIQAVENSFGPSGRTLSKPGRVLMGEGCLLKQGRRKPEPKAFFLFNDMLMYGGIILNGRWYKNQRIIPLEEIQLEDIEDSMRLKNQWLIRTPRKSFFVAARTNEEKQAWIDHIKDCRDDWLQVCCLQSNCQPVAFAVSWIPDKAAEKCMRCCLKKFSATERRHHCRKCGFVVCKSCSKHREVLSHIHPTKRVRVCSRCYTDMKENEVSRQRGDSEGKNSLEEDELEPSSDEEEGQEEELMQSHVPSKWLDFRMGTWGHTNSNVYPKPAHLRPHSSIN